MNFNKPPAFPKKETLENKQKPSDIIEGEVSSEYIKMREDREKHKKNYEEVLDRLLSQRDAGDEQFFRSTINEIEKMAEGEDLAGIREEYYSGWSDSDFNKLLIDLEEKEDRSYESVLKEIKLKKEENPRGYRVTLEGLVDMARGGNLDGYREEYYPNSDGWSDDKFKILLKDLGEE